jgi:hypothetical protein
MASIHKALVPTGTTGDVVVTYATTIAHSQIALYRSTGGQIVAAGSSGSSTAPDPGGSITIEANGYAVGGSINSSSGSSATWTGLTEQFESVLTTTTTVVTGALLTPVTLQSAIPVAIDWTASTEPTGVWAAWAPVASGTTPPTNLTLGVGPG